MKEASLQPISFSSLLKEIKEGITTGPDHPVKFIVSIKENARFYGDSKKIKNLIECLIDNALQFRDTRKPESYITIKVETSSANVQLVIADNGVGMKEKFDSGDTDSLIVTGNILKATREKVAGLKGTISIDSTPEIGTAFEIILPNGD